MKKILVVDDQNNNRYMMQVLLKGNGYEVMLACDGAEALEIAHKTPPDLIISDVLMPVMDGFSFCRECKKDKLLQEIPFVFYTGTYRSSADEELGLDLGAEKYIVKPSDPDKIIEILKDVFEGIKTRKPARIKVTAKGEELQLKAYNSVLVRKLEDKANDLERANIVLKKAQKELAKSEAFFRSQFELGNIGIAITSPQKGWLKVNDKLCKMLGYTEDELKMKTWVGMTHPEDMAQDLFQFDRLMSGEIDNYNLDKRFFRKDNSVVYTHLTVSCFRKDKGEVDYAIASVDDITEQKIAEDSLKVSEDKYKSLFRSMLNAFALHKIIVDENNNPIDYLFLEVNKSFEGMTGLKADNIVGKRVREVFPGIENDPADWINKYGKVALTGEGFHFERFFQTLNKWFSIYAYCPKKDCFAVIFEDISERRRAERDLRENEAKYRSLVDNLPAITYISALDDNSTILYISPQIESILGIAVEKYKADPDAWRKHLHPDDCDRVLAEVKRCHKSGEVFVCEYRMLSEDGSIFWFYDQAEIVRDSVGSTLYLQGVMFDITERKKQAIALKEKNIAMREIMGQIELEKNRIQNDVVANIEELALPTVKKLRLKGASLKHSKLLEQHLKNITSSFGRKISDKKEKLTPKEIEICSMIKGGLGSKDIARLLGVSHQTIDKHRKNIRKKMNLSNKEINLSTYLQSL